MIPLHPIMRSNWFKYLMTGFLLVMYINRGLFVAAPGFEISCAHPALSNEINSLLEIIIYWTGGHNHVDEDGDSPESYSAAHTIQPLIDPNSIYAICLTHPNTTIRKIFYLFDESILSLYIYGTIDHPPEQLIIDNC